MVTTIRRSNRLYDTIALPNPLTLRRPPKASIAQWALSAGVDPDATSGPRAFASSPVGVGLWKAAPAGRRAAQFRRCQLNTWQRWVASSAWPYWCLPSPPQSGATHRLGRFRLRGFRGVDLGRDAPGRWRSSRNRSAPSRFWSLGSESRPRRGHGQRPSPGAPCPSPHLPRAGTRSPNGVGAVGDRSPVRHTVAPWLPRPLPSILPTRFPITTSHPPPPLGAPG